MPSSLCTAAAKPVALSTTNIARRLSPSSISCKQSRFISSLFTFSPVTPLFIGVSGGEEFSLSIHPLFTPLHPFIFFLIKNYLKISFSVLSARKRGMLIKESSLLRLSIEYLMRKPGEYLLLYSIKLRPVTLVPDFTSTGITSKPR